jgi:hypothetical protein
MDALLRRLRELASDPENVPREIRGRVMRRMEDVTPSELMVGDGFIVPVGYDVHSCTASVAALAYWLTGGKPRSLSQLRHTNTAVDLASLASDEAIAAFLQPIINLEEQQHLLAFHTPHHKFAVLCVGREAALVHSNQDDTRGGRRFTLSEWLAHPQRIMTHDQLTSFIRCLALASSGVVDHEATFAEFFGGCRFRRGNAEDYWVALIPVSAEAEAAGADA